jgi:uncharacterized protein (DUF58 family)
LKLTRSGFIYIFITLLLGFAAVNTGNNLLYLMVSALLGFIAVSGVLGKWNLDRVHVCYLPPDEIYDGLPTLLSIELVNRRRWLPIFLMEIVVADCTVFFPVVDPQQGLQKSLELTLCGRGRRQLPAVAVRSRFPVNFFIRSKGLIINQQVTVFPAPLPCPDLHQIDPGGGQGSQQNWQKGYDGDINRIRDYQGGEPLKSIHWKLSARHDHLKVKELSAVTRKPVVLDLAELPGPSLEQRLRYASYLVTRWLRDGWPVGLKAGSLELSPGTGQRHKLLLLQALAHYGQDQKTP